MYRVIVHRRASRYLKRLPKYQKDRIKNILNQLENQPFDLLGVKHMVGEWDGISQNADWWFSYNLLD